MNKINPSDFGLAAHSFREFNVNVPASMSNEELVNPNAWQNVINQCRPGDEIRVRADDDSFTARLYVAHVAGTESRLRLIYKAQFEELDIEELDANAPYFIRLQGPKKFCIIKRDTGEVIKDMIPTKKDAHIELDDYMRALAS